MMADEKLAGIQDSSEQIWRSGDAELFALADWTGKIVALHTLVPGFPREAAEKAWRVRRFPVEQAAGGSGRGICIRWRCTPLSWAVRRRK